MKRSILLIATTLCMSVAFAQTKTPQAPKPAEPPKAQVIQQPVIDTVPAIDIKGLTLSQNTFIYQIFEIAKSSLIYNPMIKKDQKPDIQANIDSFTSLLSQKTVPIPVDTAKKSASPPDKKPKK